MTPSTRDRPAKPPLSEQVVVEAALELLRAEGPEAVTMRRVAAALDTGAASLYVYVAGREGLLHAMLEAVAATIDLEVPDAKRWRAQLHALLQRIHDALSANPGIASMTAADPPMTAAILALTENMLGILLAGGLTPQDAAWGCDTLILLVTGSVVEDEVRRAYERREGRDRAGHVEDLFRAFAGLAPERFPLLTAHASEMVAGDGNERFRFAVDVAVDGLVAKAARPSKAS